MIRGVPWSDDDVRRLREMRADGVYPTWIASMLGCSAQCVYSHLHKHGLMLSPEDRARRQAEGRARARELRGGSTPEIDDEGELVLSVGHRDPLLEALRLHHGESRP